jgi:hypothetical protein
MPTCYPLPDRRKVLWSDPDLARDRRFADSPLEETGFEPSVPRDTTEVSRGLDVPNNLIWRDCKRLAPMPTPPGIVPVLG